MRIDRKGEAVVAQSIREGGTGMRTYFCIRHPIRLSEQMHEPTHPLPPEKDGKEG